MHDGPRDDGLPPANDATTPAGDEETTVIHRDEPAHAGAARQPPGGWNRGRWTYAIVAGLLVLMLLLFIILSSDDDGNDDSGNVAVTQSQDNDSVEDEDDDGSNEAGDDGSAGAGGEVDRKSDVIVIERDDDGGGDAAGAEAEAEGGDVIVQRRRGDEPAVTVTVDDERDLAEYQGATFKAPAATRMNVRFVNETDTTYNAYVEAGSGETSAELGSMEPFVRAGQTREESFTTPPTGTFTLRIEDDDGNTVLEGVIELEQR